MEDRRRVRAILRLLAKVYPDARCALDFTSPLELLVATILSAQCTDERVNVGALPEWLKTSQAEAEEAVSAARADANTARFVFLGILLFFILLYVLSDLACRNRIGQAIARAEQSGINWEAA